MLLDTNGFGPSGKPEREPQPRPQLTLNQQKVLFWITGFNLVLMLVAPIGGATLLEMVFSWLR